MRHRSFDHAHPAAYPQLTSNFFTLSPELRNRIYHLVLHIPGLQLVKSDQLPPSAPPSVLSLLQTCRQIRDEAQGIFYACNELRLARPHFDFLRTLSLPRLKAISTVTILTTWFFEVATVLVKRCQLLPRLKTIKIQQVEWERNWVDPEYAREVRMVRKVAEKLEGVDIQVDYPVVYQYYEDQKDAPATYCYAGVMIFVDLQKGLREDAEKREAKAKVKAQRLASTVCDR